MSRSVRLLLFDGATALCYALFLWAPWDRNATAGTTTLTWLALPVILARHGASLQSATITVTICALAAVALGALLSVAARMRGRAVMLAFGAWLFGCSVAILMSAWTAIGFLGALLLLLTLRSRFLPMPRESALASVLEELWPIGYAAAFAAFAWRYNPQLLLKGLLIAFGVALIARALLPASAAQETLKTGRDHPRA